MSITRARFPLNGVAYRSAEEADLQFARGAWLRSTLAQTLRLAAREQPEKDFIITDSARVTFGEFDRTSDSLAAGLSGLGLAPGDRALFQMGTQPETLLALFACYKAGVIPVCTLPQHRELEIGQLASLTQPSAYFVQGDFSATFDLSAFATRLAAAHGISRVIVARGKHSAANIPMEDLLVNRAHTGAAAKEADPEDVAALQLSGGSTGIPKVIPRMHGEYLGQASSWVKRHQLSEADVFLWALPLIHNAATVKIVLPALLVRASLVLQATFELSAFLGAIERHRVTYAGSIGPIASRVLAYKAIAQRDLRSIRVFYSLDRAGPLEHHLGRLSVNMFGITEGLLMSSSPDDPAALRHETIGYPSGPWDEVRILVPGSEEAVSGGGDGELCFRGPYSLIGYYKSPEATVGSLTSDGFFRTGDIVRRHGVNGVTGYVFCGRIRDNISRGNEKFSAEEVESLISQHPDVVDGKVVAMPDKIYGEKACAFIILREERPCPSVAELGDFLIARGLAKYKLPERIEVVDAFPVTRVGKVDKMAMRSIVAAKLSAETG